MHEINGFAILNEAEVALVLGRGDSGGANVIRIAAPSLSRSGLEKLCREAGSLSGPALRLAGDPELGSLLAEGLHRQQAARQARSDSAACQATALALRDPDWRKNREVLAQLARVTDPMGRPFAIAPPAEGGKEEIVQGDHISSFEELVSSLHRILPSEPRRVLANLYAELGDVYQSRCEALLRYQGALTGVEMALQRSNPWLAKGYYRPMRDGRERVLADTQGRIFFEYVKPASPTRWARNAAKNIALASGSTADGADRLAARFRFIDIASGELRAGMQNVTAHFSHALASKKVTDPYARAFAIVFWSVKDFLDSRSGEYPEVIQGAALREAAGRAASLLELPHERAVFEEAMKKTERRAGTVERRMEAVASRSWQSQAQPRSTSRGRLSAGRDRSR